MEKDNIMGEGLLRQLQEHHQAISALAGAPQTRELVELLSQLGNVEQAAAAAASGSPAALAGMLEGLMQSPRGEALTRQLQEQARQAGLE